MARFTTNDGVGLHFTDAGSGRPVVLVHGYAAPAAAWALTEDALVAAGYRVICFDRRSTGESDTPIFGQRMARHGRDLAELLEHLDLDGAALVGASMGANVIWAYVDQCGTTALTGIVAVDQTPKMVNTADWPYGFYGLEPSNVGTLFAAGIPDTGQGRTVEASTAALSRLVQRLGGMPAFRDTAARW
jgi:non-heme chloroperoxidase